MKSLFTAIALFLFLSLEGQNFIDNHFPTYEDLEESTVVHISARSFDLASVVIPEDASSEVDVKELVSSIESLDVVVVDNLENATSEFNRGINILDRQYDELVNYKESGGQFAFYIDEANDVIYELVGIGLDDTEFILISIVGEMELETIGQIINMINSEQMQEKADIKTVVDVNSFSIYPNPIKNASELNLEIPKKMIGGTAYIYDIQGAILSKFQITDTDMTTNTSNLRPGSYMVGIEKGETYIRKQLVVVR